MIEKAAFLACLGILGCEGQSGLSAVDGADPGSRPVERGGIEETVQSPASIHLGFDKLLKKYVRDERVDYLRLRDEDWEDLESYLDRMAAFDLAELSERARLAFYINLYNATMIYQVGLRIRAGFGGSDNDFALFKEPFVRHGKKLFSLNDLENEVIRKRFDEPRIHVALVCGARSCPPLIKVAYTEDNLDSLLEQNMRRFVNDSFRNKLAVDRVLLSKIFEWYADDFGGKSKLRDYISKFTRVDVSKAELGFLEYQWELNLALPTTGRWVQVQTAGDGLEIGDLVEVLGEEGQNLILRRPFNQGKARLAVGQVKPLANS